MSMYCFLDVLFISILLLLKVTGDVVFCRIADIL